jgi:hypothetical protein
MRNRARTATIPGWHPPRITVTRIGIRTTATRHVEYSTEPGDLAAAPAGHPLGIAAGSTTLIRGLLQARSSPGEVPRTPIRAMTVK